MPSYNPSALLKGLKTTFARNHNPDMRWIDRLCMNAPSTSDQEKHPWVGPPPQMVEFTDEVQFFGLSDAVVTLTNKIYAAGLEFRRKDLDDQQSNLLDMKIRQMVDAANGHYNKELTTLIQNGDQSTYNSYDDVSFFNDSHPARDQEGGTQDNLLSQTGTTTANLITDLALARAARNGFKSENGEPFWGDLDPKEYVMCGPGLEHNMREVLQAPVISQTSNVYYSSAELLVNRRLTGDTWFLFSCTDGIKPFIFQPRDPIEFAALDNNDSDTAFLKELYRYKVRSRDVFGYAYWQAAIQIGT
jgi:phage major head subunit gpT-like protein